MIITDSEGKEQSRIEGYLPKDDFRLRLEMALARIDFNAKRWSQAQERYSQVARQYQGQPTAAEALYWSVVSRYKGTNDHTVLPGVAQELSSRYPGSEWAQRASVWLPQEDSSREKAA